MTLKELREILRDRRTIVTLVLMPLLLYPLLSIAFQQFFLSSLGKIQTPRYVIGFRTEKEGANLLQYLAEGGLMLDGEASPFDAVANDDSKKKPHVSAFKQENLEQAVRDYQIDVGLKLVGEAPLNFDPRVDLALDIELIYNKNSSTGQDA